MRCLTVFVLSCFIFCNIIGASAAEVLSSNSNSGRKAFIAAESRVRGLAIKSENDRKSAGLMMGGSGGLMIIVGLISGSNQSGSYGSSSLLGLFCILEGAVFLAAGAASYLIPTGIENDYINLDKVDKNNDAGKKERELLAENALKKRSEESYNGRMWGSALLGGAGLLYLTMGSTYSVVGLLYGGMAAYSWLNKTDIEKEYEQYLGDKELVGQKLAIKQTDRDADKELLNEMLSGEAK
jgi:hypothetical protein